MLLRLLFLDICIISPGVLSVLFKILSFAISHLRNTELSIPTRKGMYTAAVVNLSQIGRKMAEIEFCGYRRETEKKYQFESGFLISVKS